MYEELDNPKTKEEVFYDSFRELVGSVVEDRLFTNRMEMIKSQLDLFSGIAHLILDVTRNKKSRETDTFMRRLNINPLEYEDLFRRNN